MTGYVAVLRGGPPTTHAMTVTCGQSAGTICDVREMLEDTCSTVTATANACFPMPSHRICLF
jgi:hypothetical protein